MRRLLKKSAGSVCVFEGKYANKEIKIHLRFAFWDRLNEWLL